MSFFEFVLIVMGTWFVIKFLQAAMAVGEDKERNKIESDPAKGSRGWYAKLIESVGGKLIGFGTKSHPEDRARDKFYVLVWCLPKDKWEIHKVMEENQIVGTYLTVIFDDMEPRS